MYKQIHTKTKINIQILFKDIIITGFQKICKLRKETEIRMRINLSNFGLNQSNQNSTENNWLKKINPLTCNVPHHIETSQ